MSINQIENGITINDGAVLSIFSWPSDSIKALSLK